MNWHILPHTKKVNKILEAGSNDPLVIARYCNVTETDIRVFVTCEMDQYDLFLGTELFRTGKPKMDKEENLVNPMILNKKQLEEAKLNSAINAFLTGKPRKRWERRGK